MEEDNYLQTMYEEMDAAIALTASRNSRLLKAIKSVTTDAFYEGLVSYIDELASECNMFEFEQFEIVRETTGKWQDEDWAQVCVDQWSVGDSGDSWNGFIYIEIKAGRYLKIHYSM